jgi:hypothetical protein
MKKSVKFFMGMLALALAFGFAAGGCASAPLYSPGEALDAIGTNRAGELQYYAGGTIALTLMHTKNGQPDNNAVIKNGLPSYTRTGIVIPAETRGIAAQRKTAEDGRLMLGIAFEEDESRLLWFIQDGSELTPASHFILALDESSTEDSPVIKYGNVYYWVSQSAPLLINEKIKADFQSLSRGRRISN